MEWLERLELGFAPEDLATWEDFERASRRIGITYPEQLEALQTAYSWKYEELLPAKVRPRIIEYPWGREIRYGYWHEGRWGWWSWESIREILGL